MQDTGIVRRIDELGRVVIPKELRRTLRLREGDPLEIYTDNERLVFKKYSPLASINLHASAVAEGISDTIEKTCWITDNDTVIYSSSQKDNELIGKTISVELEKVMKNRKSVVLNKNEGNVVKIIKGGENREENQIIAPIISNGDCYGAVIVLDGKGNGFNKQDLLIAELGASVISKQFE